MQEGTAPGAGRRTSRGRGISSPTARPDQKFIFASTGSIYGSVPDYVCNEQTPRAPITLYGETKALAEEMVLEAGNGVCYRYATAFGVSNRMRLDLMPNDFTYQAVKNRNLIVYEGGFKRTFVHVRDMARSIMFALDRWDEVKDDVYNVGHETMNFTKEDVARQILKHTDFYLHFAEVGSDADQRNYEVSYEKIRSKGFETTIDLDRGIAELVRAAKLIEFPEPVRERLTDRPSVLAGPSGRPRERTDETQIPPLGPLVDGPGRAGRHPDCGSLRGPESRQA